MVAAISFNDVVTADPQSTLRGTSMTHQDVESPTGQLRRWLQFGCPILVGCGLPPAPAPTPSPAPRPVPTPAPCMGDGETCVFSGHPDCSNCCNEAGEVWDKWTCGNCLPDGDLCGEGTTCNQCCSGSSEYWYSKALTACGQEPCKSSGSYCLLGTSCNSCCSGDQHFKWSKLSYYCN